jgi:hypothetical protein
VIRTIIWGVIVIAVGTWLWLANLGVLASGFVFRRDWPVIIVAAGLLTLGEGISWAIKRRCR